jgi:hypothetical protein
MIDLLDSFRVRTYRSFSTRTEKSSLYTPAPAHTAIVGLQRQVQAGGISVHPILRTQEELDTQ